MNTTCEETDKKPPENERNDAPAREAKTLKYSSGVGRAMLLTGISALAVSLLVVIFSGIGASAAFRLGVRTRTCVVDMSDNARLEYYAARPVLTGVTSCRFFLKDGDRTSVSAAVDFLAFLKQQDVALNAVRIDSGDEEAIAAYLSGDGGPEGIDDDTLDLADRLKRLNSTLPPQKRVVIRTGAAEIPSDGEYEITSAEYTGGADGVLDVGCLYPETNGCNPLFDVKTDKLRFGCISDLDAFSGYLSAVSGNFGGKKFDGVGVPEFYFLVPPDASGE